MTGTLAEALAVFEGRCKAGEGLGREALAGGGIDARSRDKSS